MNQIPQFIISLLLFTVLLFNSCNMIGAGTYPYVEDYYLDITKEELIDQIAAFKTEYPRHKVIQIQLDGSFKEVKDQTSDNRYLFYFYLPQLDMIMQCVIVRSSKYGAGVGFYGISNTDFTGFKEINTSDFTRKENKYYKKLFEEEILTPLKEFISGDQ